MGVEQGRPLSPVGRGRAGCAQRRLVEPALEQFCRAARQVGLYWPRHPVAAAAVEESVAALQGLLSDGRPLEVLVLEAGLEGDGQPLSLGGGGLRQFHRTLRSHSIQRLAFHPGIQAYEVEALLALLNADPEEVETRGGAAREFGSVQAPHIRLEQQDYRRLVRESEAQWLATFWGAAEAGSSTVEQLVSTCSDAVGGDEALVEMTREAARAGEAGPGRLVPGWVAVAEGMAQQPGPGAGVAPARGQEAAGTPLPPEDYLAHSLATLVQRAWERLTGRDYSERVRWRQHVGQLIRLLTPEMRARLVRTDLAASPGRTDVLTDVVRGMTPDEAVDLIMGHPDGVVGEPSARLEAVLRRAMGDEQRLVEIEPLLRQRLMARGMSADNYRSVVGLVLDRVAKDRALARPALTENLQMVAAADSLLGDGPALEDLIATATPPAPERARRGILLEILEMEDLAPAQFGDAVDRVRAELLRCAAAGEADGVIRLATSLARQASPEAERGPTLRAMAGEALRRRASDEVIACLVGALRDQPDEGKLHVTHLLGQMGEPAAQALLEIADHAHSPQVAACALRAVARGGRAQPETLRVVRAAAPQRAGQMVRALAGEGGEGAAVPIALFLEHRDAAVRRCAVAALGEVPGAGAQNVLLSAMFDGDLTIRAAAADSLGRSGARGAVLALGVAATQGPLAGRNLQVRTAAVAALGRVATPECAGPLIKVLRSPSRLFRRQSDELRALAAQSLARIGGEEAEQALLEAAQDRRPAVSAAGRKALQWRARQTFAAQAGGSR